MKLSSQRLSFSVAAALVAAALTACASGGYKQAAKGEDHAVLVLQQEKGPLGLLGGTRVVVDRINGEETGSLWSAGAEIRVRPGPLELVVGAIEDTMYGVCVLTLSARTGVTYDIVADPIEEGDGDSYRLSASVRGGKTVGECTAEREARPFTPLPAVLKGTTG